MSDHVLHEKVRQPAPGGLRRARLIDPLLHEGAPRAAFVVAPPGCGKTTLLAHVAAASGGPVAWYRAEEGDGAEPALVRHLTAALGGCGLLGDDASWIARTDALLHALDTWSGSGALLVVDDVHQIAGTPAEQSLGRLLDLGPRRLRVVLGSRRMPELNVSRLQVTQEVLRLDAEDLRFRSWEVEQLFRQVYGEPLPPESSAALSRRTQGWAAGLAMFHLATAGGTQAARRAAVETLNGRSRLVRGYLADNVLRGLPDDRRRFMVGSSALGLMTGVMCDELLGVTGSHGVLRRLEDDQLFTTSDDDGETFRYHQVLQDHLELVLHDQLGRAHVQNWYRRSAVLLEREGHVREALRAFAVAEDWASARQLLLRAGAQVADGIRSPGELRLPAEIAHADPWLTLAEARHRARRGGMGAAADLYRHAESMLADAGSQAQCRRERTTVSVWLPGRGAGSTSESAGGPPSHWGARLRLDLARLRLREPRAAGDRGGPDTAGDRLELGLAHLLAGRGLEAARELGTVRDEAEQHSLEQVAALTASALLGAVTGRETTAELEAAALAADVAGQPWCERLSRTALRSLVCVARGEPDAGVWDDAVAECRRDGDEWGECLVPLLRAALRAGRTATGHGDPAGRVPGGSPTDLPDHVARLDDVAEQLRRRQAPVLAVWADALRALGLARLGSPAGRTLVARVDEEARLLGMPGAQALATYCRAHLDGVPPAQLAALAAELGRGCGVVVPDAAAPVAAGSNGTTAVPAMQDDRHDDRLEVRLLGGFALTVGGRELPCAGVRPRAMRVLRVLALSPGVDVHRERLVDVLWPDADVGTGTHRLQVAVSGVRQALDHAGLDGRAVLARRGDAYRLSLPPGGTVDVVEVEHAASESSRARARGEPARAVEAARRVLDLYRGELLPEDGPAEWVVHERERLRQLVAVTARELAEDCGTLGDVAGCLAAAHRSLELDPAQDLAWDLLVRAHERAGDRAAAARARREHARATRDLVGR